MINRRATSLIACVGVITLITGYGGARADMEYSGAIDKTSLEPAADFRKADLQLNEYYRKIKAHTNDPVTMTKLVDSERAWIKLRDAEANFEASWYGEGGTVYTTLYWQSMADLTNSRIKQLKQTVSGRMDGSKTGL